MNIEDFVLPAGHISCEPWQLGALLKPEVTAGGIVLIFCSDYRGIRDGSAELRDFRPLRRELYHLSALDFEIPICDLGDLISGNTPEDTHFALQEIILFCIGKGALPVVIGGSNELSLSLFRALNLRQADINYTQISSIISLENNSEMANERNFLAKILSSEQFTVGEYCHMGYQKHLNEADSVQLMKEVDFEVVRLADMMNSTEKAEPLYRRAHLLTLNCDAVESFSGAFSVNPQVNGLNRREICAHMKEAGLSEKLMAVGIFNAVINGNSLLYTQLLAQMIWHLVEGINIRRSHPSQKTFETFWVMIGEHQYAFQKDAFTGLWYFGDSDDPEQLIPCAEADYANAKRGFLARRFTK